jgi:hypothetical protein
VVRLNPELRFVGERTELTGASEVVWGRRLCPARILVLNVPTPESGHRSGDVVLHDGDPVGTRRAGDREYSVFNEIALWERSPLPTLSATLTAPGPDAVADLDGRLGPLGFGVEDWTANVQLLCRACSEGSPDDSEHHHPLDVATGARTFGFSGDLDRVAPLLAAWAAAGPGRSVEDLRVALA